jgi:hypothetical protein
MPLAKRPALPNLRPPIREAEDRASDDVLKRRLRVAARGLGFGESAGNPAAAAIRTATRSIQLVVPEYLFEEMGVKAVRRRVTKRFLILEALAAAGYRVEPSDMDEDGRRRR